MSKTAVTRVTHSCHLIEIGGRTFLTDPWFSTRPGYYQGEPVAREHRRVGLDLPPARYVPRPHARPGRKCFGGRRQGRDRYAIDGCDTCVRYGQAGI
jgi:L-ascorbate metabolism protein UlaG (beta-lactamase superfamily)